MSNPSPNAPVRLRNVRHRYASGTLALDGLSLDIRPGEFVCLLGPSGCGKSTVLRLVAGLEAPSGGTVECPGAGRTGYVFQSPTLMPWATVADNVALPLRLAGGGRLGAPDRRRRVEAALARVGLDGFAGAWPAELSGGMQMRASFARALATEPALLLMDEPFGALDDITRQQLDDELLRLWQARPFTALFVTHNVAEAVCLGQRVVVMGPRPGRVVADLELPAAPKRSPDFRHGPAFQATCQKVAQALREAMAGPA